MHIPPPNLPPTPRSISAALRESNTLDSHARFTCSSAEGAASTEVQQCGHIMPLLKVHPCATVALEFLLERAARRNVTSPRSGCVTFSLAHHEPEGPPRD